MHSLTDIPLHPSRESSDGGCDPDFDRLEDLDREFAEFRRQQDSE